MDFILFIFLFGVFLPNISSLQSSMKQDPNVLPSDEEPYYSDVGYLANRVPAQKNIDETPIIHKSEDASANEKTDNFYKDAFTTQNSNGTESEISASATTDLKFPLKNYKLVDATTAERSFDKEEAKANEHFASTPNVPEFWTMLAKVISGSLVSVGERDQFFQPVPGACGGQKRVSGPLELTNGSDLNDTNEGKLLQLEEIKLKLMLGISLLTLILLIPLLIFCFATLFKARHLSNKNYNSQHTVDPELATRSYFHPSQGVSDTSFSKSGESSSHWGNTSSDLRQSKPKESKSESMDSDSDQTGLHKEPTSASEQSDTFPYGDPNFLPPE